MARIFTLDFLLDIVSESVKALPFRRSLACWSVEGQEGRVLREATVLSFRISKVCVVPLWLIEIFSMVVDGWDAKELMAWFLG